MAFGNVSAAPQLAFDNPATLLATNMATGVVNVPTIDVSNYQILHWSTNNGGGMPNVMQLQFSFYAEDPTLVPGTPLLAVDVYKWDATDPNGLANITIPCRGRFMQIFKSGIPTFTLTVIGSNRSYYPWMQSLSNRVIVSGSTNVNNGAVQAFFPTFRYDGPISIGVDGNAVSAAALPLIIDVNDLVTNTPVAHIRDPGVVDLGSSRNKITLKCVVPRNSWRIDAFNASGTTMAVTIAAVIAPEGT